MRNEVPIYFEVQGNGKPALLPHGFQGAVKNWNAEDIMDSEENRQSGITPRGRQLRANDMI
jgi:hypothetical protein